MGGKLSTTRNCVAIWCDKPVYYSGDIVQGYVLLNVHDSFAAGSVNVQVKGVEKTSWVRVEHTTEKQGEHTHSVTRRHHHSGKKEFFRIIVPLAVFNGPLALGQYQFPFRVILPVNLPGSFRYEACRHSNYENIIGRVTYKVAAEVVQGQPKGKHAHLHDCAELVVRQRIVRPPSELMAQTTTTVKCCCFSSKGMVVVRMRADKDMYAAGETAYILLEVENRTELAFPDVRLKVERVVHLRSNGGSVCCHTDTIFKHRFPGLAKGESHVGANAQRLAFPVPRSLVPTTLASLVKCSYQAWVEMSAGLLTNNPRLCVPLTIYAAPPPHEMYAQPPAYWQPQVVYPAVDVKIPSAPYVADGYPAAPPMNSNAASAPPMPYMDAAEGGKAGGYAPGPYAPPYAAPPANPTYGAPSANPAAYETPTSQLTYTPQQTKY